MVFLWFSHEIMVEIPVFNGSIPVEPVSWAPRHVGRARAPPSPVRPGQKDFAQLRSWVVTSMAIMDGL